MQYLIPILTVAGIHILAAMSPGPDFIMVTKNSLVHSRRSGVFSALGLGAGVLTHVSYCLAGIGLVISQSILLFNAIKIIGAAYLIYIGFKALTSKAPTKDITTEHHTDLSDGKSFRMGYITNITNPKVTLFLLSLFTLVISPHTPFIIKAIMGLEMTVATSAWFIFVSYIVSHRLIKSRFHKIQHRLEQVMGGLLILLGLKVAFSSAK